MSYVSRYTVTLNGISMASLDSTIAILDVKYEMPRYKRNLFQLADRNGARPGRTYKDRAAVSVEFEIHEQDIFKRQAVCQQIISWAKDGGELQINDRPGQKLVCVCEELPFIDSVCKWTDFLTVMFAAYDVPYWQEITPTIAEFDYESGSATTDWDSAYDEYELSVPGNAPYTLVEMQITDFTTQAPQTNISVINTSRDDGEFSQSKSGAFILEQYSRVVLEYDENMIVSYYFEYYYSTAQEYRKSNQLGYLDGIDEIRANCGKPNVIKFRYGSSNTAATPPTFTPYACKVTFKARGLWE